MYENMSAKGHWGGSESISCMMLRPFQHLCALLMCVRVYKCTYVHLDSSKTTMYVSSGCFTYWMLLLLNLSRSDGNVVTSQMWCHQATSSSSVLVQCPVHLTLRTSSTSWKSFHGMSVSSLGPKPLIHLCSPFVQGNAGHAVCIHWLFPKLMIRFIRLKSIILRTSNTCQWLNHTRDRSTISLRKWACTCILIAYCIIVQPWLTASGSQPGVIFPPRKYLTMSGDILVVMTQAGGYFHLVERGLGCY